MITVLLLNIFVETVTQSEIEIFWYITNVFSVTSD